MQGEKLPSKTSKTGKRTEVCEGAGRKTSVQNVENGAQGRKSVKGSLKGSKIRNVKVKVGKKSVNRKYVKKYKKYFTKKNAGRKVSVK